MSRVLGAVRSVVDPRASAHGLRLLHFYRYSHVAQRRRLVMDETATMAPNTSLRNAERIEIGARAHIGERCMLWAGNSTGRIRIGDFALFGPEVIITASNYGTHAGTPVMLQDKVEQDVVIGRDVWLGARVIVLPGVTVAEGCVVAAGAVVTKDLPAGCIAAGVPARPIGMREDWPVSLREASRHAG